MLPVKIPVTPSISLLVQVFPDLGNDTNPMMGNRVCVVNEILNCPHWASSIQGEEVLFVKKKEKY